MSDYELIIVFHESVDLLNSILINYVSLIFSFLIAGYLVAAKLKTVMVALIVILFSALSGFLLSELYLMLQDTDALTSVIENRVLNNEFELPGLGMANSAPTLFMRICTTISTVGAYFGALLFFFHERHQGLKKHNKPLKNDVANGAS